VAKHTWPKTYPTNPTRGVEGGEKPLPDGENPRRVGYPTPTRHYPTTPDTAPLSGGVGYLSGGLPDKGFCDKEGHKAHLEEGLSGLSGGLQGG
jgi:hypothetical protein